MQTLVHVSTCCCGLADRPGYSTAYRHLLCTQILAAQQSKHSLFTCTGPLLAHSWTCLTLLCRSCCSACLAMSVGAKSATGLSSTRAQSSATLPMPHTATDSTRDKSTGRSRRSGWPLYHHTNSRAACTPWLSCSSCRKRRAKSVLYRDKMLLACVMCHAWLCFCH